MAITNAAFKVAWKSNEKVDTKKKIFTKNTTRYGEKKVGFERDASNQFLDSDVPRMFDGLLKEKRIELPEMKRSKEVGRTNDPKHCKSIHLVGHMLQDCFVFKDNAIQLAREGKISLEEDKASMNVIDICFGGFETLVNIKEASYFFNHAMSCKSSSLWDIARTELHLVMRPFAWFKASQLSIICQKLSSEKQVRRILVYAGSAINLLPLHMLNELEISIEEFGNRTMMTNPRGEELLVLSGLDWQLMIVMRYFILRHRCQDILQYTPYSTMAT